MSFSCYWPQQFLNGTLSWSIERKCSKQFRLVIPWELSQDTLQWVTLFNFVGKSVFMLLQHTSKDVNFWTNISSKFFIEFGWIYLSENTSLILAAEPFHCLIFKILLCPREMWSFRQMLVLTLKATVTEKNTTSHVQIVTAMIDWLLSGAFFYPFLLF